MLASRARMSVMSDFFCVIDQRDNGNNLRTIFELFIAGLCNLQLKPAFSCLRASTVNSVLQNAFIKERVLP